jgi:hypothetical protein
MSAISKIEASNSLAGLAVRINAEHEAVTTHLKRGLAHAIAAGKLLLEAKAQLKHGQWLPWLGKHCPGVPERTASHYMRLAKHADQIGNVADLTVSQAIACLAPGGPVEASGALYQFLTQLALIDPRITVTPTGMKLPPDLSYEKWKAVGELLLLCFTPTIRALESEGR